MTTDSATDADTRVGDGEIEAILPRKELATCEYADLRPDSGATNRLPRTFQRQARSPAGMVDAMPAPPALTGEHICDTSRVTVHRNRRPFARDSGLGKAQATGARAVWREWRGAERHGGIGRAVPGKFPPDRSAILQRSPIP